ncbi:MAG: transposase family protein [Acetobacteraceae bacterium]|nr:transposase family protein [Acetobacteraceae bacterium]
MRQILPGPDRITLIARPRSETALCPLCNHVSRKIHNRYQRTLADLPWHGRGLEIRVEARRFRCANPACSRSIFAERLGDAAAAWARRTTRLRQTQRHVALTADGKPGERLARRHAGQRRNIVANDPGWPGNAASRTARARDRRLGLASRSSLRNYFGRP